MPPIRRFAPVYIIFLSALVGLSYVWFTYVPHETGGPVQSTAPVLFAGVAVAVASIFANAWSQWQSSRITHALQGLQTLRTDREYLINSNVVVRTLHAAEDSAWGQPLGPSMIKEFREGGFGKSVDEPTFREASLFMLNQYEFLAAATRSGGIDLGLMEQTMAGPIRQLVTTFQSEIVELRKTVPRAFVNLIWLHRVLSGSQKPYLGPFNVGD